LPLKKRRVARRTQVRIGAVDVHAAPVFRECGGAPNSKRRGDLTPRCDGRMEPVAVRDEYFAPVQRQAEHLADRRIVVARDCQRFHAVLCAQVEQAFDCGERPTAPLGVHDFCGIAAEHEPVEPLPERSKRVGTA